MKLLGLIAIIVTSLAASASSQSNVVVDENAVIKICSQGALGCTESIVVNGKGYKMLFANKKIKTTVQNMIGTYKFHHFSNSRPFKVTGIPGKVTGVFPNPTAEFDAFKILKVENVILPK